MAEPAPKTAPVPEQEVFVVAPDGGTYAFPLSQAAEAIRRGARLETPEERRAREVEARREGEGVAAGIEGALRGATMGLSDVVGALGGQAEAMSERREAFPTVSTVTEIAGGLAGLGKGVGASKTLAGKGLAAVSTPARLVTRAGVAVERGAEKLLAPLAARGPLGKLAAKGLAVGAGSGAEGAIVGAQQWMTESVLGETEPTAEALLDHVGAGAMFGGLLGGGLGAAGEGVGMGLSRAGRALREALPEGKALESGLEDLWAKGARAATGVDEDAARAVIRGRDAIPAAQQAPERIGRELAEKLDEFGELSDEITINHRGPKTQKGIPAVEKEVDLDRLQEALLGVDPEAPGALRQIEAMVADARNQGPGAFAGQGQIKQLSDALETLQEQIATGNMSKAQIIDAMDGFKRKTGALRKQYSRVTQSTPDVISSKQLFDEVYRIEKDLLEDAAVTGETFSSLQRDVNKHFAKDLELSHAQAASGMVKAHGERGFLDPEAALRGEVIWRHDPAAMEAFARNLGENPNAATLPLEIVEGRAVRRLETMEAIGRHYDLGPQGAQKLERARTLVKEIQGLLEEAKAAGLLRRQVADVTRASGGTGINVGSGAIAGGFLGGPLGAAAGAVVGALFDPVRAAQQLSTIQRLLGAQRLDVVRRVGSYVRSATAGAKRAARHVAPQAVTREKAAETRKARVEAYRRQLSGMARTLSDPEAAQRELMAAVRGIDYAAPRMAQAMQAKGMRVVSYLHGKMAKPARPAVPFAASDGWEPSDMEIERAAALTRVAMKPSALLDDLERGTITGEQVETVRDLHPHVYQQIVDELTDRLSSLKEDLPYDERVRLTVLFGVPIEPSAAPEAMATWQATYQAQQVARAEAAKPPTEATARSIARVASESMTDTQRLESKA